METDDALYIPYWTTSWYKYDTRTYITKSPPTYTWPAIYGTPPQVEYVATIVYVYVQVVD